MKGYAKNKAGHCKDTFTSPCNEKSNCKKDTCSATNDFICLKNGSEDNCIDGYHFDLMEMKCNVEFVFECNTESNCKKGKCAKFNDMYCGG